jgi:hypothetical protein
MTQVSVRVKRNVNTLRSENIITWTKMTKVFFLQLILSSCSPYFEEILSGISPYQHPVLFMRDIPFWILKSLCDFMYAGEVHIFQNKLEELLTVAEALKVSLVRSRIQFDHVIAFRSRDWPASRRHRKTTKNNPASMTTLQTITTTTTIKK